MFKASTRFIVFTACLVVAVGLLSGCSSTPGARTPAVPPYEIPPETWNEFYEGVITASSAAEAEADASARSAMQQWVENVRHGAETEFVPWYCSYWTQQWLGIKAAWYQGDHSNGGPPAVEQLAAYLQEQFGERVVEPARERIDPAKVMDEAASVYVRALRNHIRHLQDRYRIPEDQLRARFERIPAIVGQSGSRQGASLYQVLQADDITKDSAYSAYASAIRGTGPLVSFGPLTERFSLVAAPIVDKAAGRLAGRGAATAASAALGGVGILLGIGVSMWSAIDYDNARPAVEAEIRQQLTAGLDSVWNDTLANLDHTVLGPVHHMSTNIAVGLIFPQ